MPARILIVDHRQVQNQMDFAEREMRARGCVVVRYPTMDALKADADSHRNADIIVVSTNYPFTRDVMTGAPKLRAVIFPANGTDSLNLKEATAEGIVVGNGAYPENPENMAEATVMMMLVGLYDLHHAEQLLREGKPRPEQLFSHMLAKKTVGIIGFGKIGRGIAERLQGWKVELLAYSPSIASKPSLGDVKAVELDELLRRSDVVCVVCALNDQTRGMIDERRLRLLKPTALLVNTSRGAIIDEAALYRALKERWFWKAGLDVFTVEPLPMDSPLRELDNVLLTPHIVGHTIEGLDAGNRTLLDNMLRVLSGEPPLYVRNPEVLPRWKARWEAAERLIDRNA